MQAHAFPRGEQLRALAMQLPRTARRIPSGGSSMSCHPSSRDARAERLGDCLPWPRSAPRGTAPACEYVSAVRDLALQPIYRSQNRSPNSRTTTRCAPPSMMSMPVPRIMNTLRAERSLANRSCPRVGRIVNLGPRAFIHSTSNVRQDRRQTKDYNRANASAPENRTTGHPVMLIEKARHSTGRRVSDENKGINRRRLLHLVLLNTSEGTPQCQNPMAWSIIRLSIVCKGKAASASHNSRTPTVRSPGTAIPPQPTGSADKAVPSGSEPCWSPPVAVPILPYSQVGLFADSPPRIIRHHLSVVLVTVHAPGQAQASVVGCPV